ncbi:MAG TPA: hypothetical protein VFQ80_14190 [Thermomicrobiales bacterium]|nr:hypothetical protein [Thermomicrobiales bacterium]
MDSGRFDGWREAVKEGLSRRVAIGRLAGGAAAALAVVGVPRRAAAQQATPSAATVTWQALHLEVEFVPQNPVSITVAGSGPPQRGDWFYVDAPIYNPGEESAAAIGVYQCFGAWTAAATANDAPNQRLTSIQFHLPDGMLMGFINEGGPIANQPNVHGAILGGTGAYAGASGTFNQFTLQPAGTTAGTIATPGGTPAPVASVVRSTMDVLVPKLS